MALFDERIKTQIRSRLAGLEGTVTMVNFTQELECETCADTRRMLEELAELSDKIRLEVHNFVTDREQVAKFGVDKIPATVLVGDRDRKVRFYGIPSGYEFATLLDDIKMISSGDSGLSAASREKLKGLTEPVHLEVFTTPT